MTKIKVKLKSNWETEEDVSAVIQYKGPTESNFTLVEIVGINIHGFLSLLFDWL